MEDLERLMFQVLAEASRNANGFGGKLSQADQREANEWLESDSDDWPMSFENICHQLRLDSGSVRRKIQSGVML